MEMVSPEEVFHTRTVVSALAEAMYCPLGDQSTAYTASVCPRYVSRVVPSDRRGAEAVGEGGAVKRVGEEVGAEAVSWDRINPTSPAPTATPASPMPATISRLEIPFFRIGRAHV